MSYKILVGTQKPFAKTAVDEMKKIIDNHEDFDLILLENYKDHSELVHAAKDVDALIIRSDKANAEVINNSQNLKVIVRAGAGYDNIDLQAATDKNIVAMNTPGQNSNAVAELAFGIMINIARNNYNGKSGRELRGKTIGIHAYGNIGKFVALIAKGFGMNVLAFDPFVSDEAIRQDGVSPVSSVEELYQQSDYLSLHIPANEKTKKSINYSLLSTMKEGACLINTARKEVIDEEDLKKILSEDKKFYYGSDIAPDCKDFLLDNYADKVFFTAKKMGAQTSEANINAALAAVNQIINYLKDGDTTFKVN